MMKLEKSWYEKLKDEIAQPYIHELKAFLEREKKEGHVVYPPESLVFHAFSKTPYDQVKVVIIGQDPYHGQGQAHGLSFSVPTGISLPPSLRNIYREMEEDVQVLPSHEGCLTSWAKQGVLLLNATLTVRAKEPKSHHGRGWERFTDAVVRVLLERKEPVIFLLWGKSAQEKCAHIPKNSHHVVLTAAHPSPYSAHSGFFGCRHFSKANAFLEKWAQAPIDWSLSPRGLEGGQ